MTDGPTWIMRRDVDAIHSKQLREHGGRACLRDAGLLDSALAAPRNQQAYGEDDLALLAASYADAIVCNHPYVDGNKRTAFLCAFTFLMVNGLRLTAPEEEAVDRTIALASGVIGPDAYAEWLRANSTKTDDTP